MVIKYADNIEIIVIVTKWIDGNLAQSEPRHVRQILIKNQFQ